MTAFLYQRSLITRQACRTRDDASTRAGEALRREPEDFARYVIDLYETGRAKIGSLEVKPGADCRNYRVVADDVAAVDWVALASLRDGGNALLDYQSPSNEAAGITLPGTLASWFRAGDFRPVENKTNLFFDSDLFWWAARPWRL